MRAHAGCMDFRNPCRLYKQNRHSMCKTSGRDGKVTSYAMISGLCLLAQSLYCSVSAQCLHVAVWNTGTTNKWLASSVSDSTSWLIWTTSTQIHGQFSLANSEHRRQIWRLTHWLEQRFHDVLTRTNCRIFSAHSNSAVCFEVLFTSAVQGNERSSGQVLEHSRSE